MTTHTVMTMANAACSTEGARRLYTMDVISKVCLIGSRPEISLQHLAYGVSVGVCLGYCVSWPELRESAVTAGSREPRRAARESPWSATLTALACFPGTDVAYCALSHT